MTEIFKPIKFPEDETIHNTGLEWWYFNGHLFDASGNEYAFMNCLFRVNPSKSKFPSSIFIPKKNNYFSHHILSDIKEQKCYPAIKPICFVTDDSFRDGRLDVRFASPFSKMVSEITEVGPYYYHIKNENLDLYLKSKKKPLLEGGTGFLIVNDETTYYYSLTDLETEGEIFIDGKVKKVTGKSWFDHQWSDPKHQKINWDWFSIQLENHADLICVRCVEGDMSTHLASAIFPDNRTLSTDRVEFINADDYWTSPKTLTRYPLSWTIKIPKFNAELNLKPMIRAQEMLYGFINYWEGPLAIEGIFENKKATGRGFMELTGYPYEINRVKLIEREIMDLLNKKLGKSKK
ncbi:MAG: lipocalin family protein [Minisyncoccia bacterium]